MESEEEMKWNGKERKEMVMVMVMVMGFEG